MSNITDRVANAIMKVETDDKISDYYKWARAAMAELRDIFAEAGNSSLDLAADELDQELRERS